MSQPDEVLHEFRPSWAAWFWPLLLTLGLWLPIAWYQRQKTRYSVTRDRVTRHRGLLSVSTEEMRLEDVSRLRTERSLGERLFGSGTIILDSGQDELRMGGVPNCATVAESIRDVQSE